MFLSQLNEPFVIICKLLMEMWTLSRVLAYFACKTPALGSKADVWQAKYWCAKVYLLCNNIILMMTSIFDCN